jgi:hypothetical protein
MLTKRLPPTEYPLTLSAFQYLALCGEAGLSRSPIFIRPSKKTRSILPATSYSPKYSLLLKNTLIEGRAGMNLSIRLLRSSAVGALCSRATLMPHLTMAFVGALLRALLVYFCWPNARGHPKRVGWICAPKLRSVTIQRALAILASQIIALLRQEELRLEAQTPRTPTAT